METGKQGLETQATASKSEAGIHFERQTFPWHDIKLSEIVNNHIRVLQPMDGIQKFQFS